MGAIPIWQFGFRIIVLYILVMIALRIMGKREIGRLSVFDFVVSMMIAELSTLPMEDTKIPLYRSFIAIMSLVILQVAVAWLQLKSHRFRHWVDGEPTVLIEHGKIRDVQMRKTRYTTHDLLTQLRQKGMTNLADVEFAILETSGQLSVFPKAEKRPVTPTDLGQHVRRDTIPMPVIVDGQVVEKTMNILRRDRTWLTLELKRRGYGEIKDVFYATVDEQGVLLIDPKDNPKQSGPAKTDASDDTLS